MSLHSTYLFAFELLGTEPGLEGPQALESRTEWGPALVPGGVHESLLQADVIAHPYYGRNEESVRWIEERDWWYRTTFRAPADLASDERLRLVFHGLDTVADIWLNGERLGSQANMFRPAVYDITAKVQPSNSLVVRFSPPLAGLEPASSATELFGRLGELFAELAPEGASEDAGSALPAELARAVWRRKATFSWGWDFGPRVPSVGIWRPVELLRERRAAIVGHHVRTDAVDTSAATAVVSVLVEVDTFAEGDRRTVEVELRSPAGRSVTASIPVDADGSAEAQLEIEHAELWWSHDLGTPALYDVTLTLLEEDGTKLDELADRVGLRTIEIDQSADPSGEGNLFRFVLNGFPTFARGANWVPADALVGSVRPERYRALVETAKQGNMNMIRIWGGGVYEHDAFYSACDELGVLIWHDFMFACVDYPSEDPVLQGEVALEAEHQVKRLRNRASLALWSGNNEVQMIHGWGYRDFGPGNWGYDFFHRILPSTVATYDGRTPYWPGSPWGENAAEGFMAVNGVLDGDRHAWEVWHGFDAGAGGGDYASIGEARHYRRYARDRGKFVSEFGIHASPELNTLRRWIPSSELVVHSSSFDHHNKDNPKNKGDALLEIITGLPRNIEQYVDFTMVSQAEGLKFGIEHYRRRQPHNNGTLIWQFNDVWPGFSWSVVDYEGVPKAGYYYAKRAFAPVLASFREADDGGLELWISNSGRTSSEAEAIVMVGGFDGTPIRRDALNVQLEPGESRSVWSLATGDLTRDGGTYAWVESPNGAFPSNRHFFAEIKDLTFGKSELDVSVTANGAGDGAVVDVVSRGYSYFVHIPSPVPGLRFTDNYLDLRDGDRTQIEVSGLPPNFDLSRLKVCGYAGTNHS
jgi:beta-mannosidase